MADNLSLLTSKHSMISDAALAEALTETVLQHGNRGPDKVLNSKLIERLEDVLIVLLGEPTSQNDTEWRWGTKGSLSINIDNKRGQWFSHEDNVGGGIIKFLAWKWALDPNTDQGEISQRATALLEGLPKEKSAASPSEKNNQQSDKWSSAEAIEVFWDQAGELSGKHGEAYLKSRGIDPATTPISIVREAQHKSNKKSDTKSFPAIIFLLTDINDEVVAVHAIRCPQGRKLDKAPKITNGPPKGAAIKLPGGKTADGEILVVEGPEDALSVWQKTGIETWAACSLGNLSAVPVRSGQRIVVIGDADKNTEDRTRAACAELAGRCAGVRLVFPRGDHKDPNDILIADPDRAGGVYRELIEQAKEIEASYSAEIDAGSALIFNPVGVDETFNPQEIPHRAWQVPGLTMLGHMTVVVSPGAVGKSSFGIVASAGVALGRDDMIPGHSTDNQGNVLLMNGEDDQNELNRRLAGVLQEYGIAPGELAGKLFLHSFYGQTPRLAEYDRRADKVGIGGLFDELIAFCREHSIRLIIIDPLIGFHNVPENLNEAMEQVAAIIRAIARETGAAVLVMHHTRKTGGNSEAHAGDAESGRGAIALIWASRIAKTLARMSKDTAKKMKLDWSIGVDLRRIDDAKMNYARANENAVWFRMKSTRIANDESVPVPVAFNMTGLAAELESDKEEARKQALLTQCSEVGETLVKQSKQGSGGQTDIGAKLQTLLGAGKSTVQNRLKSLPVGMADAHMYYHLGHKHRIWRENIGTDRAPRYVIHWGPAAKSSKAQRS